MLPVRTASPAGVGHRERKLSPCHELPKHTRPRRQERLGDRGNTCASMCTNTLRPVWTDTHGRPRTHPAAAHTAAGVTPTHTSTRAHADTHTCTSSDGLAKPFHLGRLCDLYEDPVGKRGHQALGQTETASQWVVGPGVSKGLSLPHGPLLEHSPGKWIVATLHCLLGQKCHPKGQPGALHAGCLARLRPAVPPCAFTTSPPSPRGGSLHFPGGQRCTTGTGPSQRKRSSVCPDFPTAHAAPGDRSTIRWPEDCPLPPPAACHWAPVAPHPQPWLSAAVSLPAELRGLTCKGLRTAPPHSPTGCPSETPFLPAATSAGTAPQDKHAAGDARPGKLMRGFPGQESSSARENMAASVECPASTEEGPD